MLIAQRTTHEIYEATRAGGPATTAHDLSRSPAWLQVCEKLGYDPFEWRTYRQPVAGWDQCLRRIEEREAEQAAIRAEYEASAAHMLAVMRFAPGQVREVLAVDDCEGYHA